MLTISAIILLALYSRLSKIHWGASLRTGWALGIIMGVFFGLAFLSVASNSIPEFGSSIIRADILPNLWPDAIFGITTAALISVFPFMVTWRALSGSNPGTFRKLAVTLAAICAIGTMSLLHNIGLDGRSSAVQDNIKKNLIASLPTIISGNPLAAPITTVFLQVSERMTALNQVSRGNQDNMAKSKIVPGGIN
jgi:hypothetical protein